MQTKGIGRLAALLLAALLALVLLPGAALAAAPDGMTITPETTQEEIDEHFGAGYLQIGEVGGVCTLTVLQDINMDGVNPRTSGGTGIFSWELFQGEDSHLVASRYNDFKGQTTLYGGTLVLEHNVVFGNSDLREDTSMTLENGTLEITGGSTVNAASFTVSHADIVLRPGSSAFINARDVDISHGFIFDMQKQLPWASSPQSSRGISISAADSFTLGGSVGILDNGISADYFYADNSWAQKRVFIVLTDSD